MATYLTARSGKPDEALQLYGWNAQISAALMVPAHFAEVVTRNAVSEALEVVYGQHWPWNQTFVESLPTTPHGYSPRHDLLTTRTHHPTAGKVIAELKFVFWQKMFTARHDTRLWRPQILTLFPQAAGTTPQHLRARIYGDLESIRLLRNRVAHHEPIFTRNLSRDFATMLDLTELRSPETARWVSDLESVSRLLPLMP